MKIQVTALTDFVHGRVNATRGDKVELNKGEAEELRALGLVQYIEDAGDAQAAKATPADENLDDVLGDTKMDDAPANKMDDAPDNKGGRTAKARK